MKEGVKTISSDFTFFDIPYVQWIKHYYHYTLMNVKSENRVYYSTYSIVVRLSLHNICHKTSRMCFNCKFIGSRSPSTLRSSRSFAYR